MTVFAIVANEEQIVTRYTRRTDAIEAARELRRAGDKRDLRVCEQSDGAIGDTVWSALMKERR